MFVSFGLIRKIHMKFILATKQNMIQFFKPDGIVVPATILKAGPIYVTQLKTKEKDGYEAVQVGFGNRKKVKKSLLGHLKGKKYGTVKEFTKGEKDNSYKVGDLIDVASFEEGDVINVSSISKGKGFQGVMKRHGFHGGPASHGQKHSAREAGSIGATGPQRVFKGMKMAGRMGGKRVTVKNLEVVHIDKDKGEILISGAIPGRRGTLVEIRTS
jgi:large subunit ribosomal protein L3